MIVMVMATSTLFSMFMMVVMMLVVLVVMIMVVVVMAASTLFSMFMMVIMMLVFLMVMIMVMVVMAASTLFSMLMMVMMMLVFLMVMIMVVVVMATSTLFSMFMMVIMMLMIVSFCCFTSAAGSLNNFYIWFHRLNCLSDFWQNRFRIFCCKSKLLGCKCNGYIAKLRQLTKLSLNLGCTVCTIKVLKNIYFSLHCDTSLFDIIELPQYMLKNNK